MSINCTSPAPPAKGLLASTFWRNAAVPASTRAVFGLLERLEHGALEVHLPDGSWMHFGNQNVASHHGVMRLHNFRVFGAVLKSGDVGLAECFINGDWSTPDLSALLNVFIANREQMESAIYGTWWGSLAHRFRHLLNRNSRKGSKKNIHAHYDLGNEFYRLWLDPSMNYSSAWFEGNCDENLEQAQQAKVQRVLSECNLNQGDNVLEIGCGWGALAEHAARHFDAKVMGVTLSSQQLEWAQKRLSDAQLPADLRFLDYRDLPMPANRKEGHFDAVVSVEMFEAVGREYWSSFFNMVRTQLKRSGTACIQTITIRDDLFERYVKSTDFIQQYIFPGGLLPSPAAFREAAKQAGLTVVNEFHFGADYAETLRRWRARFFSQEIAVRRLGFDTRFLRIWEFYLSYCEAAFSSGNTSVAQFTLQRLDGAS